jgi:group II intron reverse transcriptase/maturase
VLSAIYEEDFLPNSFGYRPGRGSRETSKALAFNLQIGRFGYVVEADIKGFFDHLQHDWLMKMLELRIQDGAFLGLIDKWLKGGILETDGRVLHPESGTPQGGVISPILANIYLHYVLDLWFEKVVKPRCRGRALLVRYADDFVCAFEYASDAQRFYRVLPQRLAKFGLSVAPEKTRIHRFSRFEPSKERSFCFLGYEFYWAPDSRGIARVWRRTAPKKLRESISAFKAWVREHRHKSVQDLLRTTKQKLTGHYNYFGVIGNHKAIVRYHGALLRLLHKWLNRRSQRRGMTWEKLERLAKLFNLPLPRCTEPKGGKIWVLA